MSKRACSLRVKLIWTTRVDTIAVSRRPQCMHWAARTVVQMQGPRQMLVMCYPHSYFALLTMITLCMNRVPSPVDTIARGARALVQDCEFLCKRTVEAETLQWHADTLSFLLRQ